MMRRTAIGRVWQVGDGVCRFTGKRATIVEFEVGDGRVVQPLAAGLVVADVVGRPPLAKRLAAGRPLTDQVGQRAVERGAARCGAQGGDQVLAAYVGTVPSTAEDQRWRTASSTSRAGCSSPPRCSSPYTDRFRARRNREWRLTDLGSAQARAAGDWIGHHISPAFSRYYTSEYLRARETAGHLGLPEACWVQDILLRERSWGRADFVMPESERYELFAAELAARQVVGRFRRNDRLPKRNAWCRVDGIATLHGRSPGHFF
jgi:hypothetical protein